MINRIFVGGLEIIEDIECGRNKDLILADGSKIQASRIYNNAVDIECHKCHKRTNVKFYGALWKREYICQSCVKIGADNPFYGKKHDDEFKNRLSKERSGKWCCGDKNKMFGVNIWDSYSEEKRADICRRISSGQLGDKNQFYGKTHSEETKKILAEKARIWLLAHPDQQREMLKKALEKQRKGFKSSIEKIVQGELERRGMRFKYSKILHRKFQFDFIIGEDMLLEVQGDYWHANPLFYPDKAKWTKDQVRKVELDKRKREYAESHGYKIFYIWEYEIRNKIFDAIDAIEQFQKLYNEEFTNRIKKAIKEDETC